MQSAGGIVVCCPFTVTIAVKRAGGLCQRPFFLDLMHTFFPVLTTVLGTRWGLSPSRSFFHGRPRRQPGTVLSSNVLIAVFPRDSWTKESNRTDTEARVRHSGLWGWTGCVTSPAAYAPFEGHPHPFSLDAAWRERTAPLFLC